MTPPVDTTVIANPYKVYLRETKITTSPPEPVHVAESPCTASLLPTVDGQDKDQGNPRPGLPDSRNVRRGLQHARAALRT